MSNKEECIQFYQWVNRLHYTGRYPKVKLLEDKVINSKVITYRDMTIDELYDYYVLLPDIEKKTAFIS